MRRQSSNDITRLRELAERWLVTDLEACLADVIEKGDCSCAPGHSPEAALNVLARAAFVRRLLDDGRVDMREALRTLGRRMRQFSSMRGRDL